MAVLRFIPNIFTLGNLLCGILGIYCATQELMLWSSWLIAVALVLDFLDGFLARLMHAQSELGKELDSLADLVTFGVLPGIILFQMITICLGEYFTPFADRSAETLLLSFTGFFVPLMGALRLARFNLITETTPYFSGMPIPSVAILVGCIPLILEGQFHLNFYPGLSKYVFNIVRETQRWDLFETQIVHILFNPYFYVWLSLMLGALMVSPLRMIAFKFKTLDWRSNKDKYILLILAGLIILAVLIPYISWIPVSYTYLDYIAVLIIMGTYIVVSLLFNFIPVKQKQTHIPT